MLEQRQNSKEKIELEIELMNDEIKSDRSKNR